MTEFSFYLDDGGHPDDQPVLVVAGYVATEAQWLAFEPQWRAALKKFNLGDAFHMTDFMRARYTALRRDQILSELALITREVGVRNTNHSRTSRTGRAAEPAQRHSSANYPKPEGPPAECEVGKRRDGGTRYWCLRHRADATAKYGKPGKTCRGAHIKPIDSCDVLTLEIDKYAGGIALWGAAAPVYDTTTLPMDRGIHPHARAKINAEKDIDSTFRGVGIVGSALPREGIFISETDAIRYMVSSVFGLKLKHVRCTHCDHPHLDRDWFSIHPHRRHLCAACGRYFQDDQRSVSNPICGIREACGVKTQTVKRSSLKLKIQQAQFPGGIQIWGSNPAMVWTSPLPESEGIHVHAYINSADPPKIDETFSSVSIDGLELDPKMVRLLMAQESIPSLKGRATAIICPECNETLFEVDDLAFTPTLLHDCKRCGRQFASKGRLRKKIGNPMVGILRQLAFSAPRNPQHFDLYLSPETP